MCGRFTLIADPDVIQMTFALEALPAGLAPRYNIAPTQPVLALTNEETRRASLLHWGLIPSWAKDPSVGSRMINARSETLAEKPSFRNAFRRRRCLIFADGFYEWQASGKAKRPMYIRLDDGKPFALAGLWEAWQVPESGDWLRSCTIVTTDANPFMAALHTRMPVILDREAQDLWLTPGEVPAEALLPLLRPYERSEAMSAYEVSRLVNSPHNDAPGCIAPVEAPGLLM